MLVFWKERLVVLAVPKTGTQALHAALGPRASIAITDPPELKHAPVYRYNRFFRPMFERMGAERMDIVAVIREPIDWLGSWWRYRKRPFLDGKPTSTAGVDFETFCRAYATGDRPAFADVGSQAKFIEPRPNGVAVTHLFRYEHRERFIAFLEGRLDTRIALSSCNASPPAETRLSARTEARLRRRFKADFEIWNSAL